MNRFLPKFLLFFLPIIFFILFIEYSSRKIPNDYSYKNRYLAENAKDIDILILGSSHSLSSVNPDYFTKRSFNAAHSSQSLDYDYLIFNKFKDKAQNLKVLVLPISYFTLFHKLQSGVDDWIIKNYSIYYQINYHSSKYKLEFINEKPTLLFKRSAQYIFSSNQVSNITVSEFGYGLSYSLRNQSDLDSTGISAAQRHTKDNYNNLENNLNLLGKLITESSKMGIKVVLFTPPAYSSYTNNLDQQQLSIMKNSIKNITNKYSNVVYHSFLNDDRFVQQDFSDADHLNGLGAKKMTEVLDGIIVDILSTKNEEIIGPEI